MIAKSHIPSARNQPSSNQLSDPDALNERRVYFPYDGRLVGSVQNVSVAELDQAIQLGHSYCSTLSRRERYEILMRTREQISADRETWARRITLESGLCLKDTRHEVGRACDVLLFAANQALIDDGQVYSCDVAAIGQARRIYTSRDPLLGIIGAITPFNHPLNQVVHKVAPAVATNNRIILKPSEKTPLSALAFADLLYNAGLPREMLQVLPGNPKDIGEVFVADPRIDLVTFTGSSQVGKHLAGKAIYKRLILELGGNDPLIVLEDADVEQAAKAAVQGAYKNSGQRCTAVKRLLVQRSVADEFAQALVELTRALRCGDPLDESTDIGTVIDATSAEYLCKVIDGAQSDGALVLHGGKRHDALLHPTVLDYVQPHMDLVANESFGPIAPIIRFDNPEDAIAIANNSRYALSAGVFTQELALATQFVQRLHAGTVNINEVPGYRLESTPFGGLKDSGLGYKEGVLEAMKAFTNIKTYSFPW
ncbi:phosphonoacetaldehyde dehydrogenase [Acidovorax temperans]|uniref:phosphonoacetaldehyde dehydrogenase n=1 Tax=Acidovorax temperans TaxID=80878 RepID=UPI0035AE605F